jgi:hypothetical protein
MARIGIGVVLAVVVGWFMFGRGDDAEAVTACIEGRGVSHAAIWAGLPIRDRPAGIRQRAVYPELEGAHFTS